MAEKTDPKSPASKSETRVELGTGPEVPAAVAAALGGAPIPVPMMGAKRVEASGLPTEVVVSPRETNPLFDPPAPQDLAAAKDVARLREAFGRAMTQAQTAMLLGQHFLDDLTPEFKAAAAREGFDLTAAAKVVADLEKFVNTHKPAKKG